MKILIATIAISFCLFALFAILDRNGFFNRDDSISEVKPYSSLTKKRKTEANSTSESARTLHDQSQMTQTQSDSNKYSDQKNSFEKKAPAVVPLENTKETKKANSEATEDIALVQNKTFFCGPSRTLKTLKSGIEAATSVMDGVLYVDPGIYDLINEFGIEWFESLAANNTLQGLTLKNRVHIIFSPNSRVISHYTGSNPYAKSLYSPFNAGAYGFTLENLRLECSNCRYAIHDERNGEEEFYKAHYINCSVYIDNSNNDAWPNTHCIGGGLGSNAEIIIENCIWETNLTDKRGAVYYHNSNKYNNPDFSSILVIKNCFFKTGAVTISDSRTDCSSPNKTIYMVYGNSFLKKYPGTNDEGVFAELNNPNSDLMNWGNSFRSN